MSFRTDCEAYLQLHAESASLKPRLDELRSRVVDGLNGGQQSPVDLPYLLKLRQSTRTVSDYKTPLFNALKRLLKDPDKAAKRIEKIEAAFETRDVESLHVEQNREYARTLGQ